MGFNLPFIKCDAIVYILTLLLKFKMLYFLIKVLLSLFVMFENRTVDSLFFFLNEKTEALGDGDSVSE